MLAVVCSCFLAKMLSLHVLPHIIRKGHEHDSARNVSEQDNWSFYFEVILIFLFILHFLFVCFSVIITYVLFIMFY